jgi:hypothetical protein
MTPLTYNIAMLTGLSLISGGVALVSIPAALIVAGVCVVGLTLIGARR